MKQKQTKPKPLAFVSPVHKAERQMTLYLSRKTATLNVAPGEAHLLTYLYLYGPCPIGELIDVFGHKNSTMTSMLERLAKRGYIVRKVNPDDRRSFLTGVTPRGRRLAVRARRIVESFDEKILNRVSQSQLRGFQRVMDVVSEVTGVEIGWSRRKKTVSTK